MNSKMGSGGCIQTKAIRRGFLRAGPELSLRMGVGMVQKTTRSEESGREGNHTTEVRWVQGARTWSVSKAGRQWTEGQ